MTFTYTVCCNGCDAETEHDTATAAAAWLRQHQRETGHEGSRESMRSN